MNSLHSLTIGEIATLLESMQQKIKDLEFENELYRTKYKDAKRQKDIYRENLVAKMDGQSEEIEKLQVQVAQLAFKTIRV